MGFYFWILLGFFSFSCYEYVQCLLTEAAYHLKNTSNNRQHPVTPIDLLMTICNNYIASCIIRLLLKSFNMLKNQKKVIKHHYVSMLHFGIKETSLSSPAGAALAVTLAHLSWDRSPFAATPPHSHHHTRFPHQIDPRFPIAKSQMSRSLK